MSEHSEHFVPSAGGPVWTPDPTCPTCMGHEMPAPVDWPARFRAAADAAERVGFSHVAVALNYVALWPEEAEVIGRALLGEDTRR